MTPTPQNTDLPAALRALNEAAYAAARAASGHEYQPTLNDMCKATDKLVDEVKL
nr:hypothetical protein [uncultured Roseovarius sp.]